MRWLILLLPGLLAACKQPATRLPLLGEPVVREHLVAGKTVYDSIYPVIPPFSFTDQDSNVVNEQTVAGKIYVADFIFLSCPSICPKMTVEMKKVYDAFEKDDRVLLLSHTIDPEHDSVPRLRAYAAAMQLDNRKWRFVTGNQDSIYHLAEKGYFSGAYKDSTAPGGYAHSGGLLLIDRQRHIRGVYNGTNPAETKRLISDMQLLLKEN